MEIKFPDNDHGGFAELESGGHIDTTFRIINDNGIRIDLLAQMHHGRLRLGINLNPEEAQQVGEYLTAQATLAQEDQ
ncbi:hypothetical protein NDI76_02205 [Halogeometricum sp. S1BR25-6]|uniref:Uncharacterized protein n=1 Tax=Halogeometricum salsisoli TaxID=2950536 RepID=A0ABU2G9X1_9EURY|nr:hypothetical protein [Halogeometricum sp. S1BR25-6]MDS0297554.1 hypothetical protein [Halogeometricum sp. S1BR25-6]